MSSDRLIGKLSEGDEEQAEALRYLRRHISRCSKSELLKASHSEVPHQIALLYFQ